jgi:dTMP kinase
MGKKGLFIAFEGIDGCGKSTQSWLVGRYLSDLSKYNHIVMTREPWQDQDIRKILKEDENPYSQANKLAHLFVEDRKAHVSELIMPKLAKGVHVISDRYSFSTLAYQQAQGIALPDLLKMHKGLPIPDIVFIVDIPVKEAVKRMKKDLKRKTEQKFEKNFEFIQKLRNNYLNLATLRRHRVILIDGRKRPQDIFEKQIKPIIDKIYAERISE